MLPPLIYVSGTNNITTTNASLTLSNMNIIYNTCYQEVWEPIVSNISAGPDVRPLTCSLHVKHGCTERA